MSWGLFLLEGSACFTWDDSSWNSTVLLPGRAISLSITFRCTSDLSSLIVVTVLTSDFTSEHTSKVENNQCTSHKCTHCANILKRRQTITNLKQWKQLSLPLESGQSTINDCEGMNAWQHEPRLVLWSTNSYSIQSLKEEFVPLEDGITSKGVFRRSKNLEGYANLNLMLQTLI